MSPRVKVRVTTDEGRAKSAEGAAAILARTGRGRGGGRGAQLLAGGAGKDGVSEVEMTEALAARACTGIESALKLCCLGFCVRLDFGFGVWIAFAKCPFF